MTFRASSRPIRPGSPVAVRADARPGSSVHDVASWLDGLLGSVAIPDLDIPNAVTVLNGLHCPHDRPVAMIAAAVDCADATIEAAAEVHADLLIVHHGVNPADTVLASRYYAALKRHGIALYVSHLPLDAHPELGNASGLARVLNLTVTGSFAPYHGVHLGLAGEELDPIDTLALMRGLDDHADRHGQAATGFVPLGHRTRRWAMVTGAGAGPDTIADAKRLGIDTLITGEGNHHSALDSGLAVLFGGHYATEVFGVQTLARIAASQSGADAVFLDTPQGPLTLKHLSTRPDTGRSAVELLFTSAYHPLADSSPTPS